MQVVPNLFNSEFAISWQVMLWVLPSVLLSIGIGAYLGRCRTLIHEDRRWKKEREKTLVALLSLVKSTEQLESDVDAHNTELKTVGETVESVHASGEFEQVQKILLDQIGSALKSNKRLEDDLVCTRFELEVQAQELDRTRIEARTDQLSGVTNRKGFDERLEYALSHFKLHKESFGLMLADVDHFKWINDTHGHQQGDHVMTLMGKAFHELIDEDDFVARYGGDEFAMILANVDRSNGFQKVDRIRKAVSQKNFAVDEGGSRVAVTLSIGLTTPQEGDTPADLIERADRALYVSKDSGRNQVHTNYPPLPEPSDDAGSAEQYSHLEEPDDNSYDAVSFEARR